MTVTPSIALCTLTTDVESLKKLVEHTKGQVSKVLVGVKRADEGALSAVKDLADEVVVIEPEENGYDKLIEQAGTEFVLVLEVGESLEHPEMLGELITQGYQAYVFPCRNYISGYISKAFGQHDFEPRLFMPGKGRFDISTGQFLLDGQAIRYWTFECWMNRERTLEEVRAWASEPVQSDQEAARRREIIKEADLEKERRAKRGEKLRILFYYRGGTSASNTMMTLPTIQEARRLYPKAEIVYRTDQADLLGKGKRRGPHTFDCFHPAINYVNDEIMPIKETTREFWEAEVKFESDFDLVYHWEKSMESDEARGWNGYELEATWAGLIPATGNYKPEWAFAKGEEKFGRGWVKKHCKTKRCVGVVLTASDAQHMWPHVEDWINTMLMKHPDVTIMTFGYLQADFLQLRYMRRAFDVPAELMTFEESSKLMPWYDPKRVVNCLSIDPQVQRYFPRKQRGMGLNLRQQAAVFPYLDLLVTPNTGPMHIAGALGVPTIAYFCTDRPEMRVKYLPSITPVRAIFHCSPCFGDYKCAKDTWKGSPCLREISVEQMMEEVEKRISEGSVAKR